MIDRSDVEEVAEDNLESVNSSVSCSDESSELIECGSYPSVVGQSKKFGDNARGSKKTPFVSRMWKLNLMELLVAP